MKLRALLFSALLFISPAQAQRIPLDHYLLLKTIQEDGVGVYVNHPQEICRPGGISGQVAKINGRQAIIVCQDGYDLGDDTSMVEWSDNDLDTIRHEIIHLAQDCARGSKVDNKFGPIFPSLDGVMASLGPFEVLRIADLYKRNGASQEIIEYEYEAFYAAAYLSAHQITEIYKHYCK